MVGRIQVQPHHIPHLGLKVGVVGELKGLHPMGLQLVILPDPVHRHVGQPQVPGQSASTPMRGGGRLAVQSRLHHLLLQSSQQLAPGAVAGVVPLQSSHSATDIGGPHRQDRGTRDAHLSRNRPIGRSLRGQQNNPAAASHSLRRRSRSGQGFQCDLFVLAEVHTRRWCKHESSLTPGGGCCQLLSVTEH